MFLFYYSISLFLFCFIRCLSFHFSTAKIQKLSDMAKFILKYPKCSIFVSTANQRYALFPNLQNKFRCCG